MKSKKSWMTSELYDKMREETAQELQKKLWWIGDEFEENIKIIVNTCIEIYEEKCEDLRTEQLSLMFEQEGCCTDISARNECLSICPE